MLKELSIKNFAIIDDLNISLSDGLTVLSGETGAGKSIIINAVNLLLGSRANSGLVRTGESQAELMALFEVKSGSALEKHIENCGYSLEEGLLIKRIVSNQDRGRIYINGQLSTLSILTSITEHLASISGQHAHQGLLKEDQHLLILDQFGGLSDLRGQVYTLNHKILPLIQELTRLQRLDSHQTQHLQLLEFQNKEISDANVSVGEDEALEKEHLRLKNGTQLYQSVYGCLQDLYEGDEAVNDRLNQIGRQLEKSGRIDSELENYAKKVYDLTFQIEDCVSGLQNYLQQIFVDENRLEEVESRLDLLNKLKRKYGGTLEAVLSQYQEICKELSAVENIGAKIRKIEDDIKSLRQEWIDISTELSQKRKSAAILLGKKVEQELCALKMEKSSFSVNVEPVIASADTDPCLVTNGIRLTETGIDQVRFMISPNVGEKQKPLANIASGGELSRVVLALKAILAQTGSLETVVFDEVDAGIGGSVAEIVGYKLRELSRLHQIICITHLPQIAKFGDHHFKIAKGVEKGRTHTRIYKMSEKERIDEIARMLGGIKITRTTLEHASEMLSQARTN